MNYLCHLYLSGDDPEIMTGNFAGDFVKGAIGAPYPLRMQRGILLHRRIDSFAQNNVWFIRSRRRISPHFGLYRGILVDLFYDHFMASRWSDWSAEPLEGFLARARKQVEARRDHLPPRLQELVPVIFEELIPSYGEIAGIEHALIRMSRRIPRVNPLCGAEAELMRTYHAFRSDFEGFLPAVSAFCSEFIGASANSL